MCICTISKQLPHQSWKKNSRHMMKIVPCHCRNHKNSVTSDFFPGKFNFSPQWARLGPLAASSVNPKEGRMLPHSLFSPEQWPPHALNHAHSLVTPFRSAGDVETPGISDGTCSEEEDDAEGDPFFADFTALCTGSAASERCFFKSASSSTNAGVAAADGDDVEVFLAMFLASLNCTLPLATASGEGFLASLEESETKQKNDP